MLAALLAVSNLLVIAHRGASGDRPEHTLAAYALAVEQGADFIEPDLVMTRDGVPIARHDVRLDETTDVATRPEFADRRTTRRVDGEDVTGWFAGDFTLAEIKQLRAVERLPDLRPDSAAFDGRFPVPTFAEVLKLAAEAGVGVYPELKHPTYHRDAGLPMEQAVADALAGFEGEAFVQSFEPACLRRMDALTDRPLIQLIDADDASAAMTTPAGLAEIAAYADGVGVDKTLVLPAIDGPPAPLVADAHDAGLVVHAWTFRAENHFLPAALRRGDDPAARGDLAAEVAAFEQAGVDGIFTDHPAAVR